MIRGGVLYCDLHTKDSYTYGEIQSDCLHIEYALTLPQLDKLKKVENYNNYNTSTEREDCRGGVKEGR